MATPLKNDPIRDHEVIIDYLNVTKDGFSWKIEKVSDVSHNHDITNTRLYQLLSKYSVIRRGKTPTAQHMQALIEFKHLLEELKNL